ncbi:hypothetical protein ABK040_013372 [Willaertia magna]
MEQKRHVVYIHSNELEENSSLLPAYNKQSDQMYYINGMDYSDYPKRSELIHSLIESYKIFSKELNYEEEIEKADIIDMQQFHSKDYLKALFTIDKYLKKNSSIKSNERKEDNGEEDSSSEEMSDISGKFGLIDDAPPFEGMLNYCKYIAGASLKIGKIVNKFFKDYNGVDKLTIFNFEGGRHHARKSRAAGFCYINDIVLLILQIKKKKVMCIDIDVHHGDGVQEAFYNSDRVLTVSFHQYGQGLYPGTGYIDDIGQGKGKYRNINVPLKAGLNDEQFQYLFKEIISKYVDSFKPDVLILVSGTDGLNGDPLGHWNLSLNSFEFVASFLRNEINCNVTIILGAGGYNYINTAIAYASMANILTHNKTLPDDIPDSTSHFELYKCNGFQRKITSGTIRNYNSQPYIEEVKKILVERLEHFKDNSSQNTQ